MITEWLLGNDQSPTSGHSAIDGRVRQGLSSCTISLTTSLIAYATTTPAPHEERPQLVLEPQQQKHQREHAEHRVGTHSQPSHPAEPTKVPVRAPLPIGTEYP